MYCLAISMSKGIGFSMSWSYSAAEKGIGTVPT